MCKALKDPILFPLRKRNNLWHTENPLTLISFLYSFASPNVSLILSSHKWNIQELARKIALSSARSQNDLVLARATKPLNIPKYQKKNKSLLSPGGVWKIAPISLDRRKASFLMRKSSWAKRDPQTNNWLCRGQFFLILAPCAEETRIMRYSPCSALLMGARSTRGAKKRRPAFGSDASRRRNSFFSATLCAVIFIGCVSGSRSSDWWRWKYWALDNKKKALRASLSISSFISERLSHCFCCYLWFCWPQARVLQFCRVFISSISIAGQWNGKCENIDPLSWPYRILRVGLPFSLRFTPGRDSLDKAFALKSTASIDFYKKAALTLENCKFDKISLFTQ